MPRPLGGGVGLTVLINAGPWLPVPPVDYGGVENVLAHLIPGLRRHGFRVVLSTVGSSTIPVDRKIWTFADGQLDKLTGPLCDHVGVAHAHMHQTLAAITAGADVDLVHDHLEVVGPSMLSLLGDGAPPVIHTLHWGVERHREFYATFTSRAPFHFLGVSESQLARVHPNIARRSLGAVSLGVDVARFRHGATKQGYYLTLGRVNADKGTDIAARVCRRLGLRLRMAGPVGAADARFYRDRILPHEDGDAIRWLGPVGHVTRDELLAHATALLAPVRFEEPGGLVAIEALASGTPVIATRRGVLPTIVEHGITGFLARDEEEFASLVPRAAEIDPVACRRAAEERFSATAMTERHVELYRKVLGC